MVTGQKATDKVYYKHTGYVGHLKEKSFEQHMAKDPRFVLRRAVRKMLPRNFLTQKRMNNLIFVEPAGAVKKAGKGGRQRRNRARRQNRNNILWQQRKNWKKKRSGGGKALQRMGRQLVRQHRARA